MRSIKDGLVIRTMKPEDQKKFRHDVENHLSLLIQNGNRDVVPIKHRAKSLHDFYTLLNYMGISSDLHWVTLRMNGYTSPHQYDGTMESIVLPTGRYCVELINKLKSLKS